MEALGSGEAPGDAVPMRCFTCFVANRQGRRLVGEGGRAAGLIDDALSPLCSIETPKSEPALADDREDDQSAGASVHASCGIRERVTDSRLKPQMIVPYGREVGGLRPFRFILQSSN